MLAYWVTDGRALQEAVDGGQAGLVTRKGHNPSDPSPLAINSNGVATNDLWRILNPQVTQAIISVLGPHGMLGQRRSL